MPEQTLSVIDPSRLAEAVDDYRTCEFATMSRSGVPVAWPAVARVSPTGDEIVLTTSISFPQKAFNIRRDTRVALLFSDPTGSGRSDLPQVLVRGTAVCPPAIHPGTDRLEDYWHRLAQRQPASTGYGRTAVGRWLFDWYYLRLVITVTPGEISVLPALAGTGPMAAPPLARSDTGPFAALGRELPRFTSAVLGTATAGEPPVLRRVRVRTDTRTGSYRVDPPDPAGLAAGPASLLLHSHDERLWNQRVVGALGSLSRTGDGWTFRPERLMPGMLLNNPLDGLRTLRRARATAARYLDRRGLARPTVDWAAHRACTRPLP